ncbi:LpqB family beta-propeller domain-containing protein [Streptomyces malaysiensis subsp. malaysiensis]|nr:LpqB family beta-propeller domain-containing protein [Streptomyces malaysiensis]
MQQQTVVTAPYGAWPSPVDAALVASHDGHPEYVGTVGEEVWWTAPRPGEGGRRALIRRRTDGAEVPVLAPPWNVRSKVMGYGGMPWAAVDRVRSGPLVVFVHFADQRLYIHEPDAPGGGAPRPLTPLSAVGEGLRWADPVLHPERGEVWCVLEEFTGPGPTDVRRVIAAVPLDGSAAGDRAAVRELTDDRHRFVTGPRLSPDGRRAAWIVWDHPRMPWDGTEVMLADVAEDGSFGGARAVLGGPEESVAQIEWAEDGALLVATDRTGWWNLHRLEPHVLEPHRPEPHRPEPPAEAAGGREGALGGRPVELCPREEEFAGPLWKLGHRWFAPLTGGLIAVLHGRGAPVLGVLDPRTGELADVPGPWTEWEPALAVNGTRVVGVAASPYSGHEVVELDVCTGRSRVIGSAHADAVDPAYYPRPLARTFTGPDGREIHAQLYPPHHPGHTAPDGELPPYVIWAHGGPTGRAPLVLDLEIAYFTSRGIGVAEVNYGGSTGYGRAYRERLRERWGVVDVEDCAAVAGALADEGIADRARLAIRGGSAGGWTAAASLTATDLYACATVSYPILDLVSWAAGGTHDFESRYTESLVGPFAEVADRYRERSPLHRADRVGSPFVLLQGLDDTICPPEQCERFLEAVAGRGVPHAYLTFEGEGHGFRRADTMIRALEAELSLYIQTFGLIRSDVPTLELLKSAVPNSTGGAS